MLRVGVRGRPLYYYWPELPEAYNYPGCYLFGDNLLCSPITSPVDPHSGLAVADVWFPPGDWVCWFSGKTSVP